MSVLVDTSVWIRFLAGREPFASRLDALLDRDDVVGHEFVFGELLIGAGGGRLEVLDEYRKMDQTSTLAHAEVVAFARARKLRGRGIGWIDVHLLASAVVDGLAFWTADRRLEALALEVGLATRR